jgi:hypothetical protein
MALSRSRRVLSLFVLAAAAVAPSSAQTIDDALMMGKRRLCTGFSYSQDGWDRYWEGTSKRDNGNIGTLTTRSVGWMGTYGVTDRVNLIAMLPWVSTSASAGTLKGMHGLQDLTVAAKVQLLQADLTKHGALSIFAVGSVATPLGDYTPDFYPMSIGSQSSRFSGRSTLNYQAKNGLFLDATGAYTWRGNVTLDRDAYFTDDRLFLTNEVAMPDVIDYTFRLGWWKSGLYLPLSFSQQITLGGGDIRRQDMPFVSNRMNATRVDALAMYYFTKPKNLVVRLGASSIVSGRNIGQSTAFTAAILYTFKL